MKLLLLPNEIVSNIFLYLSIQDLARIERTCQCFQSWALYEIERRIKTCSLHEDWDILIHLGHVVVTPARFDPRTKKVFYSVPMDPIRIKTMYDHRREIHCGLSWSCSNNKQRWAYDGLQIIVEEGMKEGITEQVDIQGNGGCELHASLTRLQQQLEYQQNDHVLPIEWIAPLPLIYSIQVDELSLPLSKLLCIESWSICENQVTSPSMTNQH
ncbi:uncharacterized protein BX664DRAFT_332924 [Halteromyces radiatus]|uniref:uncharacterized protein n=1 Tax=Halteromyces radiatus TaxID=101107 RepID=UPI00221FB3DF|nr:uncharacterized protein BX664DRAFT_332924 [Halteromyces radiatus]KAI8089400.1 hypothetical protein BX664DRAFT_332924 [Halteromyces radiatus]